ncbi:MAG: hypothetical protein ACFFAS_01225 [Promethearchaeota archaeon]
MDENQLDYLYEHKPRCLDPFQAIPLKTLDFPIDEYKKECWTFFQVKCKCGNETFRIEGSEILNFKDYYRGQFLNEPISIECDKCNSKNLLFNSEIYGYDAEIDEDLYSAGEENEPILYKINDKTEFPIITNFEYAVDELFEDDYFQGKESEFFTCFTLYVKIDDKWEVITDFECA